MKVAAKNNLIINWKKFHFLKRKVEFLGHVIQDGTVSPSPSKMKAVQGFPVHKTKKHVQSFLGLAGYFRKFVEDHAIIARPLTNLLKNDQPFRFHESELEAFVALKNILTSEPVLRIYNPDAITELHTDASQDGYGAALLQKLPNTDNQFHAVHFMSYKTSDIERRYHSYELEVLAITKALQKFRVYLLSIKFKIVTDCAAFTKTVHKKYLAPKIARWALAMEEYEFEIEHWSGERMKHVDSLSRFPEIPEFC